MDDRFYNGILGSETRVCGRRLHGLSLWHHVVLSAVGNPVMTPGEPCTPEDVLLFVRIVCSPWPGVPDLAPRPRDAWWSLKLRNKRILDREMTRLREWLEVQLSVPVLWDVTYDSKGVRNRRMSVPSMLALVVCLTSKMGISLADAWNMRISEARWYDVTLAEIAGSDRRIVDETDDTTPEQAMERSEGEIVALARRELSPESFRKWQQARRKANR